MTETNKACSFRLIYKKEELQGIYTLTLEAEGQKPVFYAGQYLEIVVPGMNPEEGKAYSISSSPSKQNIEITLRKMGAFSQAILSYDIGSTIETSLPYGFFYPDENCNAELVFIVGGIGITPVISILEDLQERNDSRNITLYYSNKRNSQILFKERLDKLLQTNSNFHLVHHITGEQISGPEYKVGRITGEVSKKHSKEAEYYLCGSMHFTQGMWKVLVQSDTPQEQIYSEGFF